MEVEEGLAFRVLPANNINSVDDIEEGKYLVENGEFCNFLKLKELSESETSLPREDDEGHAGLELEKINFKDLSQNEKKVALEYLENLQKIRLYGHSIIIGHIPCRYTLYSFNPV